ncbi:hypothetical protein CGRA01v4_14514 [Colletotrichum graminicola]|nr:hypothetical protein CGRA01v4_14514 [Colletotrichum graminicola]
MNGTADPTPAHSLLITEYTRALIDLPTSRERERQPPSCSNVSAHFALFAFFSPAFPPLSLQD